MRLDSKFCVTVPFADADAGAEGNDSVAEETGSLSGAFAFRFVMQRLRSSA